MKLGIMQPYFFPYIGYFQLINAVDKFVIYDNIQYTKKGWINRNKILVNGSDQFISLPIKKDSDYLNVNERFLAESWDNDRRKMLNRIKESYRKAPYFIETFELIERCLMCEDKNLFNFILHSIKNLLKHFNIETELIVSSDIPIDHQLKGTEKVMAICKEEGADFYINPIGGVDLYSHTKFDENGLKLQFQKSTDITYKQFGNDFVPWLSIIDVMMFNSKEEILVKLQDYSIT
jgi:hypothetical protein